MNLRPEVVEEAKTLLVQVAQQIEDVAQPLEAAGHQVQFNIRSYVVGQEVVVVLTPQTTPKECEPPRGIGAIL